MTKPLKYLKPFGRLIRAQYCFDDRTLCRIRIHAEFNEAQLGPGAAFVRIHRELKRALRRLE